MTFSLMAAGLLALVQSSASAEPGPGATDMQPVANAITTLMRDHHYNPEELDAPAYQAIETAMLELGSEATNRADFLNGFRAIWADAPFSHVTLSEAQGTAEQMATHVDNLRIGGGGATLGWQDETAILTVTTMMGQDTIEEINAAYAQIAARGAEALVIDLRENGGGAFAVLPLVRHVLAEPLEAGIFVSQPWNAAHDRAPTASDIDGIASWEGWSLRSFWQAVQVNSLTPIRFEPVTENRYDGPVYVLVSETTASAAEMAADALKASGRATLIGEVTAGQMLSQTVFDLPEGLQLWLPIADYYSVSNGRIEGRGVMPDIASDADSADDVAVQLINAG
ncbi:S41 family peptidase [uncultured Maricaulis sp.]|uniref:S41 family peptidase n=1 Tax=uncultured Maricaulis sp. TaxID=174710 RepID=UPI00260B3736|nr:S41 family peptidase [uncultured Maricaulis sp.]